ncbi:MAG: protein kinase [Lachnospiraceae bacterium]|nr:protein kinase [Lachnospiraceae bacterium]
MDGINSKYPLALPVGTVLAGQYVIEKVLGQGGFGITYAALDHKTGGKVAVKEFFPDSLATRTQTITVTPFSGERGESYNYGKTCFLQEAETLAQFIGNENIVRIHSYFEENGTAYFVMDYIEGTSFDNYIKSRGGKVSYEEAKNTLVPIMDALYVVHNKGIVHRDVTPDNIYITNSGVVKLLDFGAARYSLGDKSRSLDVVLKHGFAPKEQYTRRGKQGPFTDIYALGASFYFALTGRRPPDSVERLDEDDLVPPSSLGVQIPKSAEDAILKALNVQPQDRFQNMLQFKQALLSGATAGYAAAAPAAAIAPAVATGATVGAMNAPQAGYTVQNTVGSTYGQNQAANAQNRMMNNGVQNTVMQNPQNTVMQQNVPQNTVMQPNASGSMNQAAPAVQSSAPAQPKKKWLVPVIIAAASVPVIVGIILAVVLSSAAKKKKQNTPITPVEPVSQTPTVVATSDTPIFPSTSEQPSEVNTEYVIPKKDFTQSELYPDDFGNTPSNTYQWNLYTLGDNYVYRNNDEGKPVLWRCMSQIGDEFYGIYDGKCKVYYQSLGYSEEITALAEYDNPYCMYVTQDYYFINVIENNKDTVTCIRRSDGQKLGTRTFRDYFSYTFYDGFCFFVDTEGNYSDAIYYVPAADLEAEPKKLDYFIGSKCYIMADDKYLYLVGFDENNKLMGYYYDKNDSYDGTYFFVDQTGDESYTHFIVTDGYLISESKTSEDRNKLTRTNVETCETYEFAKFDYGSKLLFASIRNGENLIFYGTPDPEGNTDLYSINLLTGYIAMEFEDILFNK